MTLKKENDEEIFVINGFFYARYGVPGAQVDGERACVDAKTGLN